MSHEVPIPIVPAEPSHDLSYPAGHVVALVETPRQLASVFMDLRWAGFRTDEIGVLDSRDVAALHATTGRSSLVAWLIRLRERLGIRDDEAEVKARYEDGLREGHYAVRVKASEKTRIQALRVLHQHGARFINIFGRFTIHRLTA
jgi:hypothetical protein